MSDLTDKITALQAELAEVVAAISKARKAVSVNAAGKSLSRDYSNLLAERKQLEKKIHALKLKAVGSSRTFRETDLSGF